MRELDDVIYRECYGVFEFCVMWYILEVTLNLRVVKKVRSLYNFLQCYRKRENE